MIYYGFIDKKVLPYLYNYNAKERLAINLASNPRFIKYKKIFLLLLDFFVYNLSIEKNQVSIFALDAIRVLSIIHFLKNSSLFRYNYLSYITAADLRIYHNNFLIFYFFKSIYLNTFLSLKLYLYEIYIYNSNLFFQKIDSSREGFFISKSISYYYISSNCFEREIFDFFGIKFLGNKNLRRILTDYGFKGHPLRKDYPLTGYKELRFEERYQTIINEEVELNNFLFLKK